MGDNQNINKINGFDENIKEISKEIKVSKDNKKVKKSLSVKKKKNTEKNIKKKALRTLWVRRKKKAA